LIIFVVVTYIENRRTERVVAESLKLIYAIRIIDLEYMGAIMVNGYIVHKARNVCNKPQVIIITQKSIQIMKC